MLRAAPPSLWSPLSWKGRLSLFAKLLGASCGAIGGAILSGRAAFAKGSPAAQSNAAQDTSGGGGYPIIEWAIVVVLVGVALFVICRSSRRS